MPDIEPSTLSLLLIQDQASQVVELLSSFVWLNAAYRTNPEKYSRERLAETLLLAEGVLKDIDRNAVRLYETVKEWANQNDQAATSEPARNELDSSGG